MMRMREIKNELIMLGRELDKSGELLVILCFTVGLGVSLFTNNLSAFWILLYLMVARGVDRKQREE